MTILLWVLGQTAIAPTDPISGGAGWVGAGLLGLVLAWLLLRYLPEQDRRNERMIAAHAATIERMVETHQRAIAGQRGDFITSQERERADFTHALERILKQIEAQIHHLADAFNKDMQITRQLVEELRDVKRGRADDRDRR